MLRAYFENSIHFLPVQVSCNATTSELAALSLSLSFSLAYKLLKKRINNENGHVLGNLGAKVGVLHRERRLFCLRSSGKISEKSGVGAGRTRGAGNHVDNEAAGLVPTESECQYHDSSYYYGE